MSQGYEPSNSSALTPLWRTTLLVGLDPFCPFLDHTNKSQSNRDLSGQVPINFVTQIGVSVRAVCFGNHIYKDDAAATCFSNLLQAGYRRFILDLYWQTGSQQWGFCPIVVPSGDASTNSSTAANSSTSSSPSAAISSGQSSFASQNATSVAGSNVSPSADIKSRRQQLSISTISPSTSPTRTLINTQPSTGAKSSSVTGQSMDQGVVSCTSTVNLGILLDVIHDYIKSTEDTLQANLMYLVFNIHAPASSESPSRPALAPSPSNLPDESNLIGSLFDGGVGSFIYTPTELRTDRSNLNDSWYAAPLERQPIAEYYVTNVSSKHVHSTPDGWPCENYIEVSRAKRLLLNWGTVDPQMEGYNFSSDDNIIFPQLELDSPRHIIASTSGQLTSGCFFDPSSFSVASTNSSWAQNSNLTGIPLLDSPGAPLTSLSTLALNLTTCGISPVLNLTLLNKTASADPFPYQSISLASIWSWGPSEPRNYTNSAASHDGGDPANFRCALLDPAIQGQWRVEDCTTSHHVACRFGYQPYIWTVSRSSVPFSNADDACADHNGTFDAPRTGLENYYLYSRLLSNPHILDDDKKGGRQPGIWVNFNSLDVVGCWTTAGANASCPYTVDAAEVQRRTVLVPTIAAIIIAVVTALTVFVKCNANRRSSRGAGRRKKRGEGGWDYEGVPS